MLRPRTARLAIGLTTAGLLAQWMMRAPIPEDPAYAGTGHVLTPLADGSPEEVRDDHAVIEAYLGREMGDDEVRAAMAG